MFTWGHRLVNPRRVAIARNIRKAGNTVLKFHRKLRLNVVAIAAGMTHSIALTEDGALFYWSSADPELQCHQVSLYFPRFFIIHRVNYWIFLLNNGCTSSMQLHSLCGKGIVGISAGKYWTAAVTVTGDTYMWDGKKGKDTPPMPTRLHGVKKATSVSVGETHLLIISSLYHPCYLTQIVDGNKKPNVQGESDELCEGFMFDDVEHGDILSHMQKDDSENQALPSSGISCEKSAPSLKSLCERVAAEHLVDPRNAIQLLEIADSLGADDLKRHCEVWFPDFHVINMDHLS